MNDSERVPEIDPAEPGRRSLAPGVSVIEDYLSRLAAELARRRLPASKSDGLLAEVRHHLAEAIEERLRAGDSRSSAEAEAIAAFGPADALASDWVAADRANLPITALGLATGAATLVGSMAGVAVGRWVPDWVGGELMLPVVGAVLGLVLGTSQWLLLRRLLAMRPSWIVGTALGAAAGLTAGTVMVEMLGLEKRYLPHELVAMAVVGAFLGASIGWLQWRFGLRALPRPQAWVMVNAAALAIGLTSGALLATVGFGDLRTLAGLVTLATTAGCALGCAGSLASRHALFIDP